MPIKQDLAAGLMFIAFGALGLWLGDDLQIGTARDMGPGYLPRVLCWCLVVMGAGIALKSLLADGDLIERWRVRPLIFVLAGVAVFALSIESLGLALAVFATALVSAFSMERVRFGETLVLALSLAVSAIALFVYGLSLPISIFPL